MGVAWNVFHPQVVRGTNSKTIHYLLSYICRLNTLTRPTKAPAEDFLRLNTLGGTNNAFYPLNVRRSPSSFFSYMSPYPPLPGNIVLIESVRRSNFQFSIRSHEEGQTITVRLSLAVNLIVLWDQTCLGQFLTVCFLPLSRVHFHHDNLSYRDKITELNNSKL